MPSRPERTVHYCASPRANKPILHVNRQSDDAGIAVSRHAGPMRSHNGVSVRGHGAIRSPLGATAGVAQRVIPVPSGAHHLRSLSETGNRISETGYPKPETRNPKPDIRNQRVCRSVRYRVSTGPVLISDAGALTRADESLTHGAWGTATMGFGMRKLGARMDRKTARCARSCSMKKPAMWSASRTARFAFYTRRRALLWRRGSLRRPRRQTRVSVPRHRP